jgi:hypothetical protein
MPYLFLPEYTSISYGFASIFIDCKPAFFHYVQQETLIRIIILIAVESSKYHPVYLCRGVLQRPTYNQDFC